jgi:ATP-dependent Lon protease
MTGEITLRGRVLPVGGIREKALAARRAGITTFIMPRKNANDLHEIPRKLRQGLNFIQVDRMNEVLEASLLPKHKTKKKRAVPAPRPVSTSSPPPA